MAVEANIRRAVFAWLEEQTLFSDVLDWSTLQHGFFYQGRRISLVGQQGIWKPRIFETIPISIRTSARGPYEDGITPDGLLYYKYRGSDPNHYENRGLRQAMLEQVPLVYFFALDVGKYLATWPVYIIGDDLASLTFTVAIDDKQHAWIDGAAGDETDLYRRRYVTSAFLTRLHQQAFRARVLKAYRSRCAFCRLRHAELLDAAHIIPDREAAGEPVVTNGLALCKIHHAAYDRMFIGVSPDYKIIVEPGLLREEDGPMLRHGIQGLHGAKLVLPRKREDWPDRDRLAQRFTEFRNQ